MGNTSSDNKFLADWSRVEKEGSPGTFTNIWVQKSANRKVQMLEYPLHVSSEEEINQEREIFQQRHRHPQLVSSLHFVDESQQEFCSSNYQGKIYIENIPLTLQTVTDIPFPDALHIYSQSLQGFHFIASNIVKEPFPVLEQYIGINSEGVCKVWMNDLLQRNYPKTNTRISEVAMVRNILQVIEQNVDHSSLQGRPSPFDYIYSQSRSPSEVRFDQAINLFRNYVKQYFGNVIPDSLACVEKVGGVFVLAKNLKKKKNDAKAAFRSEQNMRSSDHLPALSNSSSIPARESMGYRPYETQQYQNSYTEFKREQPILRQTVQQPAGQVFNQESNYQRVQTPIFSRSVQQTPNFSQVSPQPTFNGSNVQASRVIVPQQNNNRVIPQVVYQNPNPQVFRNASQFIPVNPLQGSLVNQIPVNRPSVNNLPPHRTQVTESFIQNRVINSQINPSQQINIQQQPPQFNFVQQTVPQPVIVQQPPVQIVRPPVNIVASQPQVIVQNQQPVQVQTQQVLRKSIITFHGQAQGVPVQQQLVPQVTSTPYQATKATSVYVTPQVLAKINAPERVQSKTVMINNELPPKPQTPNEAFTSNEHNVRLRNNEESISSITAKTNAVQSNEQINDKFSSMKEQQIDNSTRNFYNNMLNTETSRTDNFSSYYANYTSKLYDNGNETSQNFDAGSTGYVPASTVFKGVTDFTQSKYKVDLNDGMSSAAFLNELKGLNFSSTNFKKTENNFDYGLTTYEPTDTLNKYSGSNFQTQALKYDSETYATTLTDGKYHENDLYVVGQKIEITPLQVGNSERLSYEYEEGQTPNGNIRYESEFVKVDGENGSYEEQYYETTTYQSTFQKYAAYDKYVEQEGNYGQDYTGLGDNLQTQYSRANEEQQYYNGINATEQMSEEEYQVDYDPEILADLQKLKGSN